MMLTSPSRATTALLRTVPIAYDVTSTPAGKLATTQLRRSSFSSASVATARCAVSKPSSAKPTGSLSSCTGSAKQ